MATAITSADKFGQDDTDWSISHRQPPAPPQTVAYSDVPPRQQPIYSHEPGRPKRDDEAASVGSEGKRRGSFSFLRRSNSQHGGSVGAPPVPALPATRITQLAHESGGNYGHAYGNSNTISAGASHSRTFSQQSSGSRKVSGEGKAMLRKSSRVKAEQERERLAQQQANALPRQPPRLPSHNPLPGIDSFGGEEDDIGRPNSVAIFNHAYTSTSNAPPLPSQRANFSRPGHAAMPSSNYNSSSSPSYAIRSGNAFAQAQHASSSPAVGGKGMNGEYGYVAEPIEHHESMANRGRYSYASSTAPVNVSSPRRVRRRKDPTPFK